MKSRHSGRLGWMMALNLIVQQSHTDRPAIILAMTADQNVIQRANGASL
ncbi:MAG: hypothetical protein HKN47_27410 [Pirellulaceae bacterium]|nr:hypothetical protein [Pirellulaceae bacterium]